MSGSGSRFMAVQGGMIVSGVALTLVVISLLLLASAMFTANRNVQAFSEYWQGRQAWYHTRTALQYSVSGLRIPQPAMAQLPAQIAAMPVESQTAFVPVSGGIIDGLWTLSASHQQRHMRHGAQLALFALLKRLPEAGLTLAAIPGEQLQIALATDVAMPLVWLPQNPSHVVNVQRCAAVTFWQQGCASLQPLSAQERVAQAMPDSLLAHHFAPFVATPIALRNTANAILANCDNWSASLSGLVWVDGDCSLSYHQHIGSEEHPLLLIVRGDVRFAADARLVGMLISLHDPLAERLPRIEVADTSGIVGAAVFSHSADGLPGRVRVQFAPAILATLSRLAVLQRSAVIEGSLIEQ
ncbi:hypothetical protein LJ739_00170 [Aestuariibacter halophilus]|uniref:Type II secretion system protein K n=1 Tax=Fluctibacter halophilus TaxID=226011 RepID=A0ABS8G244_9ALTE|nr:hypothetical protein [Aestuariibacter halophilus]MCC2614652.1 hypothetical protein [Aestuariibacter halophilus]